jgi:hypothetical protein
MIAELLEWIARAFVVALIFRVVARLFWPGAGRQPSRPQSPAQSSERSGGTLVRDPQCGTYVSRERSFQVGHGAAALYFCSIDCRDKYAVAHGHA